MKKGILIVVDLKDDKMGFKHYKLVSMLQSLYYPPGERTLYPLTGETLDKCLKTISK